ncbi:hypothetical protein J23TS9_06210 [Paenibacillus sp. J23TS9]|nr:hypothetical protein J23TS9_06210 [Paenibacillus sp. J23TS9]
METKLLLMENNPTVDERKKTAEAIRTAVEFPTALEKDKCLKLADLIEQGEIEKAKDLYNELKDGN